MLNINLTESTGITECYNCKWKVDNFRLVSMIVYTVELGKRQPATGERRNAVKNNPIQKFLIYGKFFPILEFYIKKKF